MAQKITTTSWTQITGLENGKDYILQAQAQQYNSSNVLGSTPINAMWLQQSTEPASTDIGLIDSKIKVSGSEDVYVRSGSVPLNVVIQEVI